VLAHFAVISVTLALARVVAGLGGQSYFWHDVRKH